MGDASGLARFYVNGVEVSNRSDIFASEKLFSSRRWVWKLALRTDFFQSRSRWTRLCPLITLRRKL
jgi:hypothetical protein